MNRTAQKLGFLVVLAAASLVFLRTARRGAPVDAPSDEDASLI